MKATSKEHSNKLDNILLDFITALLGSWIIAVGISVFTVPNKIVPGGVSGIATSLSYLTHLPVGFCAFILSMAVAVVGCWQFGIKRIIKAAIISVMMSALIDIQPLIFPLYVSNRLIAAVIGGVLIGTGQGILFLRGLSACGSDTITLVIQKHFPQISTGKMLMAIDFVVMASGALVIGKFEVLLYSVFTAFCCGKAVDTIQQGFNYAKVLTIVTSYGDEVSEKLMTKSDSGVTILQGTGGFSKENKSVLVVAVKKAKLSPALREIREADQAAFVIIQDATEVCGLGFNLT